MDVNSGPSPATRGSRDRREVLVFALFGAFLVAAPVVWAGGQLAARLSTGSFLAVGLGEAGGILVRLLASPGDPRAAWPPGARALLPGPLAYYGALVALLLALAAVALGGVRLGRRLGSGHAVDV